MSLYLKGVSKAALSVSFFASQSSCLKVRPVLHANSRTEQSIGRRGRGCVRSDLVLYACAGLLQLFAGGRPGSQHKAAVSRVSAWSEAENGVVLKGWSLTPHRLVASTLF